MLRMKSTNPQMMKTNKLVLNLESRRWTSRKFRSKSNSRRMQKEKQISNGTIWVAARDKPNRLSQQQTQSRPCLIRKDFPRMESLSPRVKSLNSEELSKSEISQISQNWASNKKNQLRSLLLKPVTVEEWGNQLPQLQEGRIRTNSKVWRSKKRNPTQGLLWNKKRLK